MLDFVKKLFRSKQDSKSALEKTIDAYNKESNEKKKNDLYMVCAEELLAGTSDVFLNHQDPTLEMTFAHNFLPIDTGMVALVFTNKEALLKYTKKENPYTVIQSYKIFDLCLHFRLENIFINYKSSNSILIALNIPKKKESEAQDLYYDLVSKGPDAYIEALEAIGWFDLEQKNKNAIRQKLQRYTNPDDYILALADIEIDGEGFEDIEAYKNFFNEIKAIVPNSKFSVIKDRSAYVLTFTVGNQRHEHALTIDGEWFQEEILIEWINPALTNSNIHENFYVLPSDDQCLYMVYASNEVYSKALENSVVLPSR